ncbi:MAG: ElyC/SanA/YdcF family protein [Desulfomonilaceae bacterium]
MDLASFMAKNLIGRMLNPICGSLLLSLIGMIFWRLRPDRRTGLILVLSGALLLLAMSLPMTGDLLVHSLELKAGAYADPAELSRDGVRWIVVLGGDLRGGDLSPADRVACSSLVRVMEGVRLWKGLPKSKLVLSGGSVFPPKMSTGLGMALLAQEIGVPKNAIVVENQSRDTEDEARFLKPILEKDRFALVTSAYHMRRSVLHFKRMGLDPIPAPADFLTKDFQEGFGGLIPSPDALAMSQTAIHEYVGTQWLRIKQFFSFHGGSLPAGASEKLSAPIR